MARILKKGPGAQCNTGALASELLSEGGQRRPPILKVGSMKYLKILLFSVILIITTKGDFSN
jgi:hypothetical protein